jgi:hypothetical protein
MLPKFSWKSDSCEPDIRSGTARWDFDIPGHFTEVKFSDFNIAVLIDTLVHKVHLNAYRDGRGSVVADFNNLISSYEK